MTVPNQVINSLLEAHSNNASTPQEKLRFSLDVFDFGARAYKKAQHLIVEIDDKIHNEFAYYGRAKTTILKSILDNSASHEDFELAVDQATSAASNILCDSLDIVYFYAIEESKRISSISKFSNIVDVYPEYKEVRKILTNVSDSISLSREVRGIQRLEMYKDFVSGQNYEKLVQYCDQIPDIEADLKKRRAKEVLDARRWVLSLLFPAAIALLIFSISI